MHPDYEKVLISEEQLQQRIQELGDEISKDYEGKDLLLVGILKGGILFLSDLTRAVSIPHEFDLIGAKSYVGTQSSGQIQITKDIENILHDKDVLVIEDIYDTGRTLNRIVELLKVRGPKSVEICCLLKKPERHEIHLDVKYVGFTIPDVFVIGFGLDYDEKYRHLKDIGILKPEIYSE